MTYKDELIKAMNLLAENEKVLFLGQAISYTGSGIYKTVEQIPKSKKIELPLIEDTQMGMSIGLSLEEFIPVSVYPRFDFLILAINQMVNHLDKIKEMSNNEFNPKVIIRTAVGNTKPLYPGLQHCSDYTEAFRHLFKNINIVRLNKTEEIVPAYKKALEDENSTILIEVSDLYNQE